MWLKTFDFNCPVLVLNWFAASSGFVAMHCFVISKIQSRMMTVCLFLNLKIIISVTTESIGFYSSGNLATGPLGVWAIFLRVAKPLLRIKMPIYTTLCGCSLWLQIPGMVSIKYWKVVTFFLLRRVHLSWNSIYVNGGGEGELNSYCMVRYSFYTHH